VTEIGFINLLVLPAALGLWSIGFGLFVTLPEPA